MRMEALQVYLRDMVPDDISMRRHWELVDTEWKEWDAPWEYVDLDQTELELESQGYIQSLIRRMQRLNSDEKGFRSGFEIIHKQNDRHIGWVNSYEIDHQIEWTPGINVHGIAIGVVIPSRSDRGHGLGQEALQAFLTYFRKIGYKEVYCQTWSGNLPMVRLAQKVGFREVERKRRARYVRGERYDAITYRIELD